MPVASVLGRTVAILLLAPCFVGVYDAVIVVTSWQRLQRAAGSVADSVVAATGSAETDFAPYFAAAQTLAQPDDVTRHGTVIISAILRRRDGGNVVWQRRNGGGAASGFGEPGEASQPAAGAELGAGPLIGAELFAPVSPWLIGAGWLPGVIPTHLRAWVLRRAAPT